MRWKDSRAKIEPQITNNIYNIVPKKHRTQRIKTRTKELTLRVEIKTGNIAARYYFKCTNTNYTKNMLHYQFTHSICHFAFAFILLYNSLIFGYF